MTTIIPIDINAIDLPLLYKPTPEGYDEPQWPKCTEKSTKEFLIHLSQFLAALHHNDKTDTSASSPSSQTSNKKSTSPNFIPSDLRPLVSIGLNAAMKSLQRGMARIFVICIPKVLYRSFFPAIPFLSALLRTPIVTLMCTSDDLGKVFFPPNPTPTKDINQSIKKKMNKKSTTTQAFSINCWPELIDPSLTSSLLDNRDVNSNSEHITSQDMSLQQRLDYLFTQLSQPPTSHSLHSSTSSLYQTTISTTEPSNPLPKDRPNILTIPDQLRQAHTALNPALINSLISSLHVLDQHGTICNLVWVRTQARHLLQQHFTTLLSASIHNRLPPKPRSTSSSSDQEQQNEIDKPTKPTQPSKRNHTAMDIDEPQTNKVKKETTQSEETTASIKRPKPNPKTSTTTNSLLTSTTAQQASASSKSSSSPATNPFLSNQPVSNPFLSPTSTSSQSTTTKAPTNNPFSETTNPFSTTSTSTTPSKSNNPFGSTAKPLSSTPFSSMGALPMAPKGVSLGLAKQPKVRLREVTATDQGGKEGDLVIVKSALPKGKSPNSQKPNTKTTNNNTSTTTPTPFQSLKTSIVPPPNTSTFTSLSTLSFSNKPNLLTNSGSKSMSMNDLLNKATKKK